MDKKQVVLMREREAYRAAIDVNLAEKERIRSAVLHAEAAPAKAARPRVRRPLVRIAIAAAALLLCTGAAFAAAEWIGRENYTPETYLFDRMGARSESEPIADVENAIAAAAPVNGSHSVQLLPALPDAERSFPAIRSAGTPGLQPTKPRPFPAPETRPGSGSTQSPTRYATPFRAMKRSTFCQPSVPASTRIRRPKTASCSERSAKRTMDSRRAEP